LCSNYTGYLASSTRWSPSSLVCPQQTRASPLQSLPAATTSSRVHPALYSKLSHDSDHESLAKPSHASLQQNSAQIARIGIRPFGLLLAKARARWEHSVLRAVGDKSPTAAAFLGMKEVLTPPPTGVDGAGDVVSTIVSCAPRVSPPSHVSTDMLQQELCQEEL
jgi:hypothetical protein